MQSKNKTLIIILVAILLIAVVLLLVGYYLSGCDVIGWFGSQYAITVYVCVGLYILIAGGILIKDRIRRL